MDARRPFRIWQLTHETCFGRCPVRFAMDRAGLVGADGATHCGAFDITYMAQVGGGEASTIHPACVQPANR